MKTSPSQNSTEAFQKTYPSIRSEDRSSFRSRQIAADDYGSMVRNLDAIALMCIKNPAACLNDIKEKINIMVRIMDRLE